MNRSFSPLDLVTVPRTSAASAMALGTALLTVARHEVALPPVFVKPLKRLEAECDTLRASRQWQSDTQEIDAPAAGKADQELDAAWSGLHGLLTNWTKLTTTPEGLEQGARARAVLERVFPQGLRFLNFSYRDQWAESQKKLDRLAEPAVAEHVQALGGGAFLRAVEVAYATYGEVLHLTKRKAEAEASVNVREPIERVLNAVRRYVLHVAAYLDDHDEDADAQKLGYALLEPLTTWKRSGGGRKAKVPDAPNGEGSEGEAGGEADGPKQGPDEAEAG